MNRFNLLAVVAVAALTMSFWALINRPQQEPAWPQRVHGYAFSPLHAGDDPLAGRLPTPAEIDADLALLAGQARAVRTYTVEGVLGEIPALARKHGLRVMLGAWLDGDEEGNWAELERLLEVIGNQLHANRVIVGNETVLRGDLSVEELIGYLDWARERLVAPVSTAEPWYVWMRYPQLVEHVDFISVHLLPYWEGVSAEEAVDYIVQRMAALQAAYPDKPVIIGEVGWPSRGRPRGAAAASPAVEASFLRRFLHRAEQEGYDYFIMEAFDQPWKRVSEGDVGAYWGVYDLARRPKFAFDEPLVAVPAWRALALASVVIATLIFLLLVRDGRTLRGGGRAFLAAIACAVAMALVWVIYDFTQQYLTTGGLVSAGLLLLGMSGVLLVVLTEAHEWAEARWVSRRRRAFAPLRLPEQELPKVSIHVPAYNEPPQMLCRTLDALAALDYPDFEVLVVDNNTREPAVWKPVEAHCRRLGPRFRFFHVEALAGFKAGALNFALRHTDPEAAVVAVIDSDYQVRRSWLRDLVPQFSRPNVAIVQAPQDYRDGDESLFKSMCHAEYRGFFCIGMVTRNERNAIIQHGTMTLVRRAALEEVGGWAEWTITEDAELGLRIFEHGYEAVYVADSYGRGLTPDTFADFKKQRLRWAFGAMQILRGHWRELLGLRASALSAGQRYHFFAGWLPWLADGVNLLFTLAALLWSAGMILAPQRFDPPLIAFSLLPLGLFAFKVAKLVYLYRGRVAASAGQTIGAAWAGLALTHVIGFAILNGMWRRRRGFFRTPKQARAASLLGAVSAARTEGVLAVALIAAAAGVRSAQPLGGLDIALWCLVLLVQAVPYVAALSLSLVSAAGQRRGGQQALDPAASVRD